MSGLSIEPADFSAIDGNRLSAHHAQICTAHKRTLVFRPLPAFFTSGLRSAGRVHSRLDRGDRGGRGPVALYTDWGEDQP
jgi:hypothetical protein